MQITKDTVVSIHYTLTDDDGQLIDSSKNSGEPLTFLYGNGYLLPALEKQMEGKSEGESFSTVLEAKDGYGEFNEKLIIDIPREQFSGIDNIEPGMMFQAMTQAGPQIVRVVKVQENTITIDGNHELAGKRLHFEIEILDVHTPSEEELKQYTQGGCGCGGNCGGDCGGDCNCDGGCGGGCGGCGN